MRVCIIGNSHVAALKQGWDSVSAGYPAIDIVFFGQRGNHMRDLKVEGGALRPSTDILASGMRFTSGGLETIDPAEYDHILVYGLDAAAYILEAGRALSRTCKTTAISDLLGATIAFDVIGKLRQVTTSKLFVGHVPLPAAHIVRNHDYPTEYVAGCDAVNRLFCDPLNVEFLSQPLDTIVNGVRTDPDFSLGSRKLAIGDRTDMEAHDLADRWHMNQNFGAQWLTQFLARINA